MAYISKNFSGSRSRIVYLNRSKTKDVCTWECIHGLVLRVCPRVPHVKQQNLVEGKEMSGACVRCHPHGLCSGNSFFADLQTAGLSRTE